MFLYVFLLLAITWVIIALIWELKIKSRRIRVYPLFIILYSKRFKRLILAISERFNRFWYALGDLSDKIFVLILIFASLYFSLNLLFLFLRRIVWLGFIPLGAQYTIVIPVVIVPVNKVFFMLIIAFLFALLLHEMFHGAVAVNEGFGIKNAGVIISIMALGGFVEIDFEETLNKIHEDVIKTNKIKMSDKKLLKKFRKVVAAGVIANLLLWAGFSFAYGVLVNTSVIQEYGVKVVDLDNRGNAIKAGLKINDVIILMNSTRIKTVNDFLEFMSHTEPGSIIRITILRSGVEKEVFVEVGVRKGRPYLGVSIQQYIKSNIWFLSDDVAFDIYLFLRLNIMIEMIIVLFNALPSFVLDGANWLQIALLSRWGKKGIRLAFIINIIFSVILVSNFVAPTIISMVNP